MLVLDEACGGVDGESGVVGEESCVEGDGREEDGVGEEEREGCAGGLDEREWLVGVFVGGVEGDVSCDGFSSSFRVFFSFRSACCLRRLRLILFASCSRRVR